MSERKRSECRSCGAPVEWAQTEKRGSRIPLDFDEVERGGDGNLVVVTHVATEYGMTPVVRNVKTGEGNRTTHFVTCPNASDHRAR